MKNNKDFDVIVIGNGLIGLTIAYALLKNNIKVAIMENKEFSHNNNHDSKLRFSAVNDFSKNFLKYLNVWQDIKSYTKFNCHYNSIQIWEKDSFGNLTFNCNDLGFDKLGYIIQNNTIKSSITKKSREINLEIITYDKINEIILDEKDKVYINTNKNLIFAKLLIGADGCNSWLRKYCNIKTSFYDYKSFSIIANINTEYPHKKIARQIFYKNSILALLPLKKQKESSMIWTIPVNKFNQIIVRKNKDINKIISYYTDMILGLCKLNSKKKIFPIVGYYVKEKYLDRILLLGDAFCTLHPLAGQGLNLGLHNVYIVLKGILKMHNLHQDIGYCDNLNKLKNKIQQHTVNKISIIHMIQQTFFTHNNLTKITRNLILNTLNKNSYLKLLIAKYAMGLI